MTTDTIETVQPEPASPPPEVTVPAADDVAASEPLSLGEIEQIRDENIDRYWAEGLDAQWRTLKDAEPAPLTVDDLALIDADAEPEADVDENDDETGDEALDADADADIDDVPESADAYELPAVENFEWDERETAAAQPYLAALHEAGATQEQVDAALRVYAEHAAAIDSVDEADIEAARPLLREQYGQNYEATVGAVKKFLEAQGDVGTMIAEARDSSGHRLINRGDFLSMIAELAAGGRSAADAARAPLGSHASNVADEEADLERLMRTDIDQYQNGIWGRSNMSPADRLLQIKRSRAAVKR